MSSTHADSDVKAVVSPPVTLRWAGTRMLRRRDAAYLGGAQWRRSRPGQPPQWNYLGQETAAIRRLTEIFHRSSDSDTSYDPAREASWPAPGPDKPMSGRPAGGIFLIEQTQTRPKTR